MIVWKQNGQNVQLQPSDFSETDGLYNAKKRQSIYKVTAKKELNGYQYNCTTGNLWKII